MALPNRPRRPRATTLGALMLCVAMAAAAAAPATAAAADARCTGRGGTCKAVSACTAVTVRGLCPGSASIRCCVPDPRCAARGGACKAVADCTAGAPVRGLCPGAASNQCCTPAAVTDTTGGGGGGGGGAAGGDPRCTSRGGTCGPVAACGGTTMAGLCAGSATIRCCIPRTPAVAAALAPIPVPAGLNPTWTSPSPATMAALLAGVPCVGVKGDCTPVGAAYPKRALFVTESVGPFRVTGIKPAVASLRRVLAAVEASEPGLWALLGTVGMTCCRLIDSPSVAYSNHSWGAAVDVTLAGVTDTRGDNLVQAGLYTLYPYFQAEGWVWGAAFKSKEDAMHFEVSKEKMTEWGAAGLLDV